MKVKKDSTVGNAFQKIISDSKRKPNKIWVDQGGDFYNNTFKLCLSDNNIEIYSTHNERKSVIVESFIRTLKNNIYNHMTAIATNVYIDVLDKAVDKYNNNYCGATKMMPIDAKSRTDAKYGVDT